MPGGNGTHGNTIRNKHQVEGALDIARTGYNKLTSRWLSFYRDNCHDEYVNYKTLLIIMSELDDTNVIHRVGFEKAQQVKLDARHLLENFSIEGLEQMNESFIKANISPGGAADMLSLTFFLSSFLNNQS
jgi:triphosphoribosyl-dephospho-CoA synthase